MKAQFQFKNKRGGHNFLIAALLTGALACGLGGCARSNQEPYPPIPMQTVVAHIVSALAIDPAVPETLYAGTNKGVYKSTDGGASWKPASTGLPETILV